METPSTREHWGTRMGFILAAVGSAVGLGNIWRFPFQVSEQGGSSFLIIYLAFIIAIGLPAMLVEFTIGRRSKRNPINAFKKLGHGKWSFVGVICVITGFVILSYYSVVAGWTLQYTAGSITGGYFDDPAAYFGAISEGWVALGLHALFMAVVIGIVAMGIEKGIEICVKLLVPAIILLLLMLMFYGLTLDGAMEGVEYYLAPDLEVLSESWLEILPAAAGQAFFTLSLGMGAMITYSSYLAKDDDLVADSGWIVGLDTGIAVLVGLVIFPVLFAVGMDPGEGGPGSLFIGLGGAIAEAPGSNILGLVFFGTVLIAAVSSAISILEVVVSYVIDNFEVNRLPATLGVGSLIFLVGIPTAFSQTTLTFYDGVVADLLLPLGMALLVVFVGWFYTDARDELAKGLNIAPTSWFPNAWMWHVRTVILAAVVLALVLNAIGAYETFIELLTAGEAADVADHVHDTAIDLIEEP